MELLIVDQPERAESPDRASHFWAMADQLAIDATAVKARLPARNLVAADKAEHPLSNHDVSHSAMNVNLDACIECNLCVRACREVQVNDVIGLAPSWRLVEDHLRF